MRSMKTFLPTAVALLGLALAPALFAQDDHEGEEGEGHSHDRAEIHGGSVTMTEEFHFETVFHGDEVLVYVYDRTQNLLDPRDVAGTVAIEFRDRARPAAQGELAYAVGQGGAVGCLRAVADLSRTEEGAAKATIRLQGLPGEKEREVSFAEKFRLASLIEYVCPMKDSDPQAAPGRCPRCGMELVKEVSIYRCAMHPEVASRRAGDACWICRMPLDRKVEGGAEEHDDNGGYDHGGHDHGGHDHGGHDHGHK